MVSRQGSVVVLGAVSPCLLDYVFEPKVEVVLYSRASGAVDEPSFCSGHLLLELLEGPLLALGVDVAVTSTRSCRSLELFYPASIALALVDASFAINALFGFLSYGLLLSDFIDQARVLSTSH